jgi:hypothetical protein
MVSEPAPDAVLLPLHGKHATTWPRALIDAADAAFATQWAWRVQPAPHTGHPVVQRSYRAPDGRVVRVVLARALLDRDGAPGGQVGFRNGDSLDLRRQNLIGPAGPLTEAVAPPEAADWPAPRGPKEVSALAHRLGFRRQKDVLALTRLNDPFVAGSPTDHAKAQWFARLWAQFGYRSGVHLRRVHYRLLGQPEAERFDWQGAPYQNTEACWDKLNETARLARYLALIAPHLLVDHRNPEALVGMERPLYPFEPTADVELPDRWALPTIATALSETWTLAWPAPTVYGYGYGPTDQPYLLEVWCEKSTMNDVLLPLCRRYHATLVTGLGYLSITAVVGLLQRVAALDKPARLLYISDFDPAGSSMPVQVARQIEFWRDTCAPGADIALVPVALTAAQMQDYPNLEPMPWEGDDPNAHQRVFLARYGVKGPTELDALEALYPGALARIVGERLAAYHDADLAQRLEETEAEAEQAAEDAWTATTAALKTDVDTITADVRAVLARYEDRLAALNDELQAELAPMQQRLTVAWHAMQQRCITFEPALPDRPAPEVDGLAEDDWLYCSDRSYVEQLAYYQRHKAGAGDEDPD